MRPLPGLPDAAERGAAHRMARRFWAGALFALALAVAHHCGVGLDERPRLQWELLAETAGGGARP